ncbi:MAG: hypothetical protein CSA51_03560 [Gammaproteobacteria bacterium]|nr:MAG: hypothetical protein CSA51_03560 [Gammaproteobacteria bacterium]
MIEGTTGTGKTLLACALGRAACGKRGPVKSKR